MNALKKLEEVNPSKLYNGFAKLTIGFHKIECFRVVKNKFGKKSDGTGKSIMIELKDQILFLPQYFWQKIDEEDINELNSCINSNKNVYLHFNGKHAQSG